MSERETDLQYYSRRLPAPLRNKYVATALVFVVWMLFFDRNNVISQIRLQRTLSGLENKMKYYEKEKKEADAHWEEVFTNDATLEKFAREQHFMKRPNEEVFVFAEEE